MNMNDNFHLGQRCNDPGISNSNTLRQEPFLAAGGFLTLQVLHYNCVPGYLIEGKNSITCQEDGTWDGSPPQCYLKYKVNSCFRDYMYTEGANHTNLSHNLMRIRARSVWGYL